MLALKVSVEEGVAAATKKRKMALPRTLVFDEIDIGIGGRAAEAVGQKLKTLSGGAAGDLHYASAADCGVCGPALPD